MRQAPRHLAPGGIALGLQQGRNVIKHNDVAALAPSSHSASGVQAHISTRRSAPPSRSICSRHSSRPAAKRTTRAATNWLKRSLPAASCDSEEPVACVRSAPMICPAASLAIRTVSSRSTASTPVDRRARMTASRPRSRSTASWLRQVSSRARRRRLVMSLKECTR